MFVDARRIMEKCETGKEKTEGAWARIEAERLMASLGGLLYRMDSSTSAKVLSKYEFRPSDVVVTTFLKSGTVLLQQMCYQIAELSSATSSADSEKKGMEFDSIMCAVPWLEMAHVFNLPPSATSPRVYKTHLPISAFDNPSQGGKPKHVVVLRNPEAIPASVLNFAFPSHFGSGDATWRDITGGAEGGDPGKERSENESSIKNGRVTQTLRSGSKENESEEGRWTNEDDSEDEGFDWSQFHPDVLNECFNIVAERKLLTIKSSGYQNRPSTKLEALATIKNSDNADSHSLPASASLSSSRSPPVPPPLSSSAPSLTPQLAEYDRNCSILSHWHAFVKDCMSTLQRIGSPSNRETDRDVLVLFYEDVIQDMESSVRTVAKFMNCPLSDDLVRLVVDRCDRTYMSKDPKFRASIMQRPLRLPNSPRQTLPASFVGFKRFKLSRSHLDAIEQLNKRAFGVSSYHELKENLRRQQCALKNR